MNDKKAAKRRFGKRQSIQSSAFQIAGRDPFVDHEIN